MSDGVPVNEVDENREEPMPEAPAVQEQPQVPAGAQLAALREARGWTIEQVASQLNLASRQIHALEADNYAALPGMVIVRGFIRAYAKLLRVDPVPILSAIASEKAEPESVLQDRGSLSTTFSEAGGAFGKSDGASSKLVIAGVILALIVVLGFVAQRMGWMPMTESAQTLQTEEKQIPLETHASNAHEETAPEVSPIAASQVLHDQPGVAE